VLETLMPVNRRLNAIALAAMIAACAPGPLLVAAQAQDRVSGSAVAAAPVSRAVLFEAAAADPAGVLVLPLASLTDLSRFDGFDATVRTQIERASASAGFNYGARQTLSLRGIGAWDRILLVGLGDASQAQWSGAVAGRAVQSEATAITVLTDALTPEQAASFATGLGLGHYRSDLYRTSGRSTAAPGPVVLAGRSAEAARALYEGRGAALVEAMAWTRDISNEPANIVYPEVFVERARAAFAGLDGVSIQVLDVPAMERLGMGSLLAVGRGSARPPRLLVVRYQGTGAPQGGPIALVGKGITFDSGGISIKPSAGMGNMKMDMSGAASVTGAVLALARSRAPVDVVAVAALAENMPDGAATRPGDVLTAMNGKTIEVISTDAEGRLVLADALVWVERNLDPAAIVDVATLTGAVGGALGNDYAGLFSRHDALADQLDAAGRSTGERLWRLPLNPGYSGILSSPIADLQNTGASGPGASTGAWFVGEFVSRDIPWAHLDIANMAYGAANDWKPVGSAGFGVRLLEEFVRNYQPVARGEASGGG
jgi:leucyl aminopeptidase